MKKTQQREAVVGALVLHFLNERKEKEKLVLL